MSSALPKRADHRDEKQYTSQGPTEMSHSSVDARQSCLDCDTSEHDGARGILNVKTMDDSELLDHSLAISSDVERETCSCSGGIFESMDTDDLKCVLDYKNRVQCKCGLCSPCKQMVSDKNVSQLCDDCAMHSVENTESREAGAVNKTGNNGGESSNLDQLVSKKAPGQTHDKDSEYYSKEDKLKNLIFVTGEFAVALHQLGFKNIPPSRESALSREATQFDGGNMDGYNMVVNYSNNDIHIVQRQQEPDKPDHLCDLYGHVTGLCLTPDQR